MSGQRDIVNEIIKVRSRVGRSRFYFGPLELQILSGRYYDNMAYEEAKSFPVFIVTILEVSARELLKRLIDHGEPYAANAAEISKEIRIDFSSIRALHGKSITLGELIAHSVSISSLEAIDSKITKVAGHPFISSIKNVRKEKYSDKLEYNKIIEDPDRVISAIRRVFEVRHILCHEWPSKPVFSTDELPGFFRAAYEFLTASQEFVEGLINPNPPKTTVEMIQQGEERLEHLEEELCSILKEIERTVPHHLYEAIDEAHTAWKALRKADAHVRMAEFSGTIGPVLYIQEEISSTESRIAYIRNLYNMLADDNDY